MILDFTEEEKTAFLLELVIENNRRLEQMAAYLIQISTIISDIKSIAVTSPHISYEQIKNFEEQLDKKRIAWQEELINLHPKKLEEYKESLKRDIRKTADIIRNQK